LATHRLGCRSGSRPPEINMHFAIFFRPSELSPVRAYAGTCNIDISCLHCGHSCNGAPHETQSAVFARGICSTKVVLSCLRRQQAAIATPQKARSAAPAPKAGLVLFFGCGSRSLLPAIATEGSVQAVETIANLGAWGFGRRSVARGAVTRFVVLSNGAGCHTPFRRYTPPFPPPQDAQKHCLRRGSIVLPI
jgi:hypothetical protein